MPDHHGWEKNALGAKERTNSADLSVIQKRDPRTYVGGIIVSLFNTKWIVICAIVRGLDGIWKCV